MPTDPFFLSQLLLLPQETLEVELKNWLDPTNKNHAAKIAKELLALANHGGGYLIFGFDDKTLAPDPARPQSLKAFGVDQINSICKKYADPAFHCEVHHVSHPVSGDNFPIVVVPGRHRVPIRCKRGHAEDVVTEGAYYFRLPGGESGPSRNSKDWDDLLGRCVFNRKEDLLNSIRSIITGSEETPPDTNIQNDLNTWILESDDSANQRLSRACAHIVPEYYQDGWWSVAYSIVGVSQTFTIEELTTIVQNSPGKRLYPPWDLAKAQQAHRDFDTDRTAEWLFFENYSHWKKAWTAYLRLSQDLRFFLLGGYAEDIGESTVHPKPATTFYSANSVEFFFRTSQHASHVCRALELKNPQIVISIRWFGVDGRHLGGFWNAPDAAFSNILSLPSRRSTRSEIQSLIGPIAVETLESNFEEVVLRPIQTVFRAFNLFLEDPQAKKYISNTVSNLRET